MNYFLQVFFSGGEILDAFLFHYLNSSQNKQIIGSAKRETAAMGIKYSVISSSLAL